MKITSQWVDGRCFVATNASGQSVIMDGAPAAEGNKRGVSPMEMLLMGIAGCSSIDVVDIAKKQRQDVLDCIATVEGKRADSVPKVFTDIHIHFKVVGRGLNPEAIGKAVQLSAEKYCSASIMLGKSANISHSFEVAEAE
ncbi:OsmC family protein [Neisseria shayeganii]|uniref:Ribosome biogenesis GTP-binding protein YsxC n=1 Tax=Neisseria shayeganii 871 TaxID=1032488 RepID=G4CFY1_9NEIS|nr:OsmC family protein [Neisseria shayeganii]EGY53222.1 ribosome biogenesis GTP-binding protein YsxC [Neisseria shayeganii 871]